MALRPKVTASATSSTNTTSRRWARAANELETSGAAPNTNVPRIERDLCAAQNPHKVPHEIPREWP
jgi:hypothetical protein